MAFTTSNGTTLKVNVRPDFLEFRKSLDGELKTLQNEKAYQFPIKINGQDAIKTIREYTGEVSKLDGSLKKVTFTTEQYTDAQGKVLRDAKGHVLKNASEQITKISASMKDASKNAKDLGVGLRDFSGTLLKVAEFQIITKILNLATSAMSEAISTVKEYDDALTEFKKVSDLSGESLDEYTEKLGKLGGEVARTRTEMVASATEFKKSGFSDEDSAQLAKISEMYRNTADEAISSAESAGFIVSQMKAYNNETEGFAQHTIDAINNVSDNMAVSSSDISDGLSKTSSAMSALGNSFEESMAMVAGATEVLHGQATKVARGLRTIGNNFANQAKKAGTLTYQVNDVTQSLSLLDEQTGDLKSTYSIFEELSKEWQNMSNAEKQSIAIQYAGKNQFEVFMAEMNQFTSVQKAYNLAVNDNGMATKENEKYMESLTAKLTALKQQFQELALGDGGLSYLLKLLIDVGTVVVKFANTDIGQLIIGLTALNTIAPKIVISFEKLKAIQAFTGMSKGIKLAYQDMVGLFNLIKSGGVGAITMLSKAEATSVILTGATLVIAGIYGITKAIEYFATSQKRAIENADNAIQAWVDAEDEVDSLNSKIEDIGKQIDAIKAKGYISVTDEQQLTLLTNEKKQLQEQVKLQKTLAEIAKAKADAQVAKAMTEKKTYNTESAGYGSELFGSIRKSGTIYEQVNDDIKSYDILMEHISAYEQEVDKLNKKKNLSWQEQGHLRAYNEAITEAKDKLNDYTDSISKNTDTIMNQYKAYAEQGVEFDKMPKELQKAINSINVMSYAISDNARAITDQESLFDALSSAVDEPINSLDDFIEKQGLTEDQAKKVKDAFEDGDYIKAYALAMNDASNSAEGLSDDLENVADNSDVISGVANTMSEIGSAYDTLSSAVEEYNSNGALSVETLASLSKLSPQYLACLVDENGQLRLNADSMDALATASKNAAIQTLMDSASKDMLAVATGNAKNMSDLATQAINNVGNASEISGQKAANGAKGYDMLADAMTKAITAGGGKVTNKVKDNVDKVRKIYGGLIDAVIKTDYKISRKTATTKRDTSANRANTDSLKKQTDALKEQQDAIKKEVDDYKSVISYIQDKVKKYQDSLKEQKDAETKALESQIKTLKEKAEARNKYFDDEIEKLEKAKDAEEEYWNSQIDAIKTANEKIEDNIKLQELQQALQIAQNSRLRVYKEGEGFVYTQDQQAISEAQKNLKEYERQQEYEKQIQDLENNRDKKVKIYEQQIQDLKDKQEKEKEQYDLEEENLDKHKEAIEAKWDEQIAYWDKWLEKFSDGVNSYETEQNRLKAIQLTGIDFENKGWQTRLGNLDAFVNAYTAKLRQLQDINTQYENAQKQYQASHGSSYGGGTPTYNPAPSRPYRPATSSISTVSVGGVSYRVGGVYSHPKGLWYKGESDYKWRKTSTNYVHAFQIIGSGRNSSGQYLRVKGRSGDIYDIDAKDLKKHPLKFVAPAVKPFYTGVSSVDSNQVALVGDSPTNHELVIGSKLNGQMMNLPKGSGVVNNKATNTLAGVLNQLGVVSSNFGKSIGTLTNNHPTESWVIENVTINGANIHDANTFANAILNLKSEALQRAHRR